MRDSVNFPVAGQVQKRVSLVVGQASVTVLKESGSVNSEVVQITVGNTSLKVDANGIYAGSEKGLTGTYQVTNSLTATNGLVTGVS